MRGVARTGAAVARSAAARSAAVRGLDLITQVGDTAAEAIRSRRDPAMVAQRRRVAARRRLSAWSIVALLLAGAGATGLVDVIGGDVSAASIGGLVLLTGLLAYALIGVTRAAVDLRARSLVIRRLPAAQPRRPAVTAAIRPLIARLDGYSDALRLVVGEVGVGGADQSMRSLREQTLAAADAAETRLRGQAAELTAMMRAGRPPAGSQVAAACEQLQRQIGIGIDEYGRLVAAASEAASASHALAVTAGADGGLGYATDQLTSLAAGMRELIEQAPPG